MSTETSRPVTWTNPATQRFADSFGARVNIAVLASGLKKTEAARILGVQSHLVQGWIAGRRLPSVPMLARACEVLDVDAHWLLGLKRGVNTYSELLHELPEIDENTTPERLDEIGDSYLEMAKDVWRLAEVRRQHRQ